MKERCIFVFQVGSRKKHDLQQHNTKNDLQICSLDETGYNPWIEFIGIVTTELLPSLASRLLYHVPVSGIAIWYLLSFKFLWTVQLLYQL